MVDTFLYKILTKVDEKSLTLDPVTEALNQVIDDYEFRFTQANRDQTYRELLSRLRYRIDLICKEADSSTEQAQYKIIHDEVYGLVKSHIQLMSDQEHELDYIPF